MVALGVALGYVLCDCKCKSPKLKQMMRKMNIN